MPDNVTIKEYYQVEIYVDGSKSKALTDNFKSLRIKDSVELVYPAIYLSFHVDNEILIRNNVYPQSDIKVIVKYTRDDGARVFSKFTFDLIILEMNVDLPSKVDTNLSEEREDQKRTTCMTCAPKVSLYYASCVVNRLFSEGSNIKPYDAVMKLIDDVQITKKQVEADNKNPGSLGQLVVPPMTFIAAVDYIDDSYGIFGGELFRHFNYEGKFLMWDVKKHFDKTKGGGYIRIHKLPSYSADGSLFDTVASTCNSSDSDFLIYDNAETICRSNDKLLTKGNIKNFIFHPTHDIAFVETQKTFDKSGELGINAGKNDTKTHKQLKDRYTVDSSNIGHWDNFWTKDFKDQLVTSKLSSYLADMNIVKFKVHRSLKITKILSVGETVNLKPYTEHEKKSPSNYSGSYLITELTILLSCHEPNVGNQIEASAEIYGIRTSQSK